MSQYSKVNVNKLVMLDEKKSIRKRLARCASFPPLDTSHFNLDGTNTFHSKLQMMVAFPIMIALGWLLCVYLLSLFTDDIVAIDFSEVGLDISR